MIKKSIAIVLVILCSIGMGSMSIQAKGDTPIINNAGFEKEISKEDTQLYKAKRVTASNGKVHSGEYAIKVGAEAPEEGSEGYPLWIYNGGKGMVNTVIRNVKPNTTYEVKAYYYNQTGVSMRMGVLDIEGHKNWQQGRLNSSYNNYSGVTSDWQEVIFKITTGPRSTELYVFALTNWTGGTTTGAGVFYVDDISINEIETVTPAADKTIDYTGADENGFPYTTPMIQNFIPDNNQAFNVDKKNQVFYSDEFSWDKAEYVANKLVEKGIINTYHLESLGENMPTEGIIIKKQAIGFTYPKTSESIKEDAYEMHISKDCILINSEYIQGIQNGTMTLLQALGQRNHLPSGVVEDYAETKVRGLQVDSGRRYYSVEWLKNEIEQMAYQKLNTMQLRLKDNEGIRYESKVAPLLVDTAGGYWTQEEVKEIINYARKFNIEIIPEIDLPGHSEQDGVNVNPEWLLKPNSNILDFSHPDVQKYMADIYKEAFDLFEAKTVHMGGDEYFQTPGYSDPEKKLSTWAQTETGNSGATEKDAFKLFFNTLAKPYLDEGKTVLVWNDNIWSLTGPVTLDERIVVDFWGGTMYGSIKASTTLQQGYKTLGSPANLYHDLWPENDKLDRPLPKFLYESWLINTYSTAWTYEHIPENLMGNSLGQMFPIWDDANGFAPEYILTRTLFPRLTIFANTMWGANLNSEGISKLSFEEYELLSYKIGPVDTEAYRQIRMDYTSGDLEYTINKITELIKNYEPKTSQQEENLKNLETALVTNADTEANQSKIFELIKLYENLNYELPVYGDVNVVFEDENAKSIADTMVLKYSDSEDGTYQVTPKNIKGYTFSKVKDGSALETGYFYKQEQVITYVYTKDQDPIIKPDDKTKEEKKKSASISTGDTTSIGIYLIVFLLGGTYIMRNLYKKKQD